MEQTTASISADAASAVAPVCSRSGSPQQVDTRRPTPHIVPSPVSPISPISPYEQRADRTIKINMEIVVPKVVFELFESRAPSWKPVSMQFWRCFMKPFIGVLYLSFIICQAVAWGILSGDAVNNISLPVVIMAQFIPFLDLLGNVWAVRLMKSDRELDTKHPSFHHAFVLIINTILLVLEVIVLIFASVWADDSLNHYWYYRHDDASAIAGMTLYSMSTMILMKIILAILVFRAPETFSKFRQITTNMRQTRGGYEELEQGNYDDDARVRRGTIVSHGDDEETPRNSSEHGRIVLL